MVLHSQGGGSTWESLIITDEYLNDIAFRDNEAYIVGNNGTLFYSSDAGSHWMEQDIPVNTDFFALSMNSTKTYFLSGSTQDYGNQGYEVYHTIDNNAWTSSWIEGFLGGGVQDLVFVGEQLGFTVASEMGLCDCCFFVRKDILYPMDGKIVYFKKLTPLIVLLVPMHLFLLLMMK